MNETDKEQELESTEEETSPDEETGEYESIPAPEVPAEEKPPKRRGNGIAWFALLLSLAALTAVAYTVSRDWLAARDGGAEDVVANLDNRLNPCVEGSFAVTVKDPSLEQHVLSGDFDDPVLCP